MSRPAYRVARCVGLAGLLAALGAAGSARAYRPFDGTDADVAELGEFELELGPIGYFRLGGTNYLITPGAVFNYGLLPRVELVLQGFNYVQVGGVLLQPRDQLLDTEVSAKIVLRKGCLQEAPGVTVATELGVLLPEVNGITSVGGSAAGIVTQCFRDLTVHYNGQVELDLEQALELFGSVILEGPRRWTVRPVAELYASGQVGDQPPAAGSVSSTLAAATTYSGLLGAIWRTTEKLDLDAAVRVASVDALWNLELRLGLTWRIP